MNNQTRPPSSTSPIPPPPPRSGSGRGCLRAGLIGCGVVGLLGLIGIVAMAVWWNRNSDEFTASAGAAARDGARFGLMRDEAACFDEARRRVAGGTSASQTFSAGAFARSCFEFSRETPGFCDNVPSPTSIRRSVDWQQQKCGTDMGCRNVSQVVQQYCTGGRPKRTAADTLLFPGDGAPSPPTSTPADSDTF